MDVESSWNDLGNNNVLEYENNRATLDL